MIKLFYQCDIPLYIDISEKTYFCYNAFGVVINLNSKIEWIQHGVIIGELNTHDTPVIEEKVYIGARAMILGNITLGKKLKIEAEAVVLTDVPPNDTAVGIPAKIIKED